jgi:hypothetical protein
MTRPVRTKAAELAVQAIEVMDGRRDAATLFSLAIFFESWIISGGDATQETFKLLPEADAKVLRLVWSNSDDEPSR